ncbi:MAG: asparaginase domain-containing protein, partial [Candidatus Verstraetearchaeota archaeon]|nr:asparaginase domain-containing protein [Candidatus Verstraetearchaeota archaeon]
MTPTYGYRGRALEIIAKYGVKVGDRIIVRREGSSFVGILMPRSELDDDAHIVLKLDDGYNLGISVESLQIEKIPQEEVSPQPPKVPASRPGLPKVSIVSTGGTIASRVDYRTGAVSPALSAEDLYQSVPELGDMAEIRTEILFSLLS